MTDIPGVTALSRIVSGIKFVCYHRACPTVQLEEYPAVVLLHGWLGTSLDLAVLATRLACEGYQVVVPDLPWHGGSRASKPPTVTQASTQILDLLPGILNSSRHKRCSVAIVGYSLGGRVALEMAAQVSRGASSEVDVWSVVLISSAPPPQSDIERKRRESDGQRHADALCKANPTTPESLKDWLSGSWYAAPMWGNLKTDDVFETLLESRARSFDELRRRDWEEAARIYAIYEPGPAAYFPGMRVLYVCGDLDEKYKKLMTSWSDLLEACECRSIPRAGHNVLAQNPPATTELIIKFLSGAHALKSCHAARPIDYVRALRYSLPLNKPMLVNGQEVLERQGVLISIASGGTAGVGDICPLPGLHVENLQSCLLDIQCFANRVRALGVHLCATCFSLREVLHLTENLSKVVQNGITCAITHLLSHLTGRDIASCVIRLMAQLIPGTVAHQRYRIRVCGVLPRACFDSTQDYSFSTQQRVSAFARSSPFLTLKVKVGTLHNARTEGKQIAAVVEQTKNSNLTFRLDANKAWTLEQFDDFQDGLNEAVQLIEFIEEPLKDRLIEKYLLAAEERRDKDKTVFFALDETLSECSLSEIRALASYSSCKALVVKPAVLGSLERMFRLHEIASDTRCATIMSTVFDSGVGTAWTCILASVCGWQSEAVGQGVGTFRSLKEDVCEPSFGELCVLPSGQDVDVQKCEEFLSLAARRVNEFGSFVAEMCEEP